jgi:hypothetical protein
MVDVMLVMLIIFMVITPMLSKGVSVDLVKTKNPIAMQAADKSDAILSRSRATARPSWAPPDAPADLPPKVKDLLANRLDKTVFVKADRGRAMKGGGCGGQPARGRRGPVGSADRAGAGQGPAAPSGAGRVSSQQEGL